MAKQSRTKSALGGKKSKSSSNPAPKVSKNVKAAIKAEVKKQVHRMHISKTNNGKFLVDHEFKSEPGMPTIEGEQHAIEPGDLSAHVGENMGIAPSLALPAEPVEPALPAGLPALAAAGPALPPAGPLGV